MSGIEVDQDGTFNLTCLDGSTIEIRTETILTLASRRGQVNATELALLGGERVLVRETVAEVLDACELSEERS